MTDQLEALRDSIVSAVQQELTRHGQQVATEVKRLQDELAAERAGRAQIDGSSARSPARCSVAGVQHRVPDRTAAGARGAAERVRHAPASVATRRWTPASGGSSRRPTSASPRRRVGVPADHEAARAPAGEGRVEHRHARPEPAQVRRPGRSNGRPLQRGHRRDRWPHGGAVRRVASDVDERVGAMVARVDEVAAHRRPPGDRGDVARSPAASTRPRTASTTGSCRPRPASPTRSAPASPTSTPISGASASGSTTRSRCSTTASARADAKFDEVEAH